MNTLYDVLGVCPDADDETLKRAFRGAIKANHPDLHPADPDAAERFREIVAANDRLRDAKERTTYDWLLQLERQRLQTPMLKRQQRRSTLTRQQLPLKRMRVTAAVAAVGALISGYGLFLPMLTTTTSEISGDKHVATTGAVVEKAIAAAKVDAVKGNAEGNVDNAGKPVETTGAKVMAPTDALDQREDKHDGTEVPNGANKANKPSDEAAAIMRFVMQRVRDGGDAQATAGRELALGPPAGAPPGRYEVAAVLARAHTYLSAGDVAAARIILRRAAERDDPQAALALGGTYDPTVLKRLGTVKFQADPAMAREWYRRAAQLGSADASLRLEQLVQTDH